jgi:O-antigen ligase
MLINQRRVWFYRSRVIPPVIALSIVAILAFLAGQLPWFAFAGQVSLFAQLGGLMLFLLSAGAFLWVAHLSIDLKWLSWLVWLYIAVGGVYVGGRFIAGITTEKLFVDSSTGSMFWVWLVALSASQALYNKGLNMRWRVLLGLVTLLTFLVGWRDRSWFSGWLPGAIAVIVILFIRDWRIGVVTAFFMGFGFLAVNPENVRSILNADQYSLFTRQEAWKIVLENIVKVSPIFGLGPANYYNYTPLFPILGYNVRFNSHNQYVDLLAQTGILGLLAFLWLAYELGWLGWRLKDRAPNGFARAYVIGALGGLAGTLAAGMLGDWVIPFVYNIGLAGFRSSVFAWMFLGGLVVIERLVAEENTQGG